MRKRDREARGTDPLLEFGPRPKYWHRLLGLAHALKNAAADERGDFTLPKTDLHLMELHELGRNLSKFALGGDPKVIFGSLETGGRTDLRMQRLNYAVVYWRNRATGKTPDEAAASAQQHFEGFAPPSKETIRRYARNPGGPPKKDPIGGPGLTKEQVLQMLEAEGYDLTQLRAELLANSKRGKFDAD